MNNGQVFVRWSVTMMEESPVLSGGGEAQRSRVVPIRGTSGDGESRRSVFDDDEVMLNVLRGWLTY